eukprot:TRINITY_DN14053_c0_g1_i1.p1 TRINITY_DN14053_c0_g1~~TRINITY_DN14053_c0_g1_i1.p1  ORF type:complete len:864 (+),score=126.59 TRINITY_DN14053_c0_g1_i1:26-2617(+)
MAQNSMSQLVSQKEGEYKVEMKQLNEEADRFEDEFIKRVEAGEEDVGKLQTMQPRKRNHRDNVDTDADSDDSSLFADEEEQLKEQLAKENDTHDNKLLPEEITIGSVRASVKRDITKTRRYRVFPLYIFFLIFFCLAIGIGNMSNDDRYYMANAIRHLVNHDVFLDNHTVDDFYSWLGDSIRRLWSKRDVESTLVPLDSNLLVGFVHFRQWRVTPEYCNRSPQISLLSTEAKKLLPRLCHSEYSPDNVDSDPYGPELRWKPVKLKINEVNSVPLAAQLKTYNDLDNAFPVSIYANETLEAALQEVQLLQTQNWMDSSTRAVAMDLLFYNPNVATFTLFHLITEIDSTGDLIPSSKSTYFRYLRADEDQLSGFLLFLDIVVFLFTVWFLIDLWLTVNNQRKLNGEGKRFFGLFHAIGFWEVYYFGLIIMLVLRSAFRFWLWSSGAEISTNWVSENSYKYGGDEDKMMFQFACDYTVKYQQVLILDAWVAIFAWLRLFEFLQYNERLNLVTETVAISFGQLGAMVIIFLIILFGFSIAGRIFYGHAIFEFRTLLDTAGYLLRLVFSADLGDYLDLEKVQPVITPLYIFSFFILTWLILLNMVLAIIAGSFGLLQERANKSAKSWFSILEDFKKALVRILPVKLQRSWAKRNGLPEPEDRLQVRMNLLKELKKIETTNDGNNDDSDPSSPDEKKRKASKKPDETQKNNETKTADGYIQKQVFIQDVTRDIMSKATAAHIYEKAAANISGPQEKSFKLSERFAHHLSKRLVQIENQIMGQQSNIDRIPAIEKSSIRQHIVNLQPKVDRLNLLQDDIRRELSEIHANLPIHFNEIRGDFSHQMANLEVIHSQRVAPQLQSLIDRSRGL